MELPADHARRGPCTQGRDLAEALSRFHQERDRRRAIVASVKVLDSLPQPSHGDEVHAGGVFQGVAHALVCNRALFEQQLKP